MRYYIYKITNLINGKAYIGRTTNLKRRWREHKQSYSGCRLIKKAIQKYGEVNFKFEVIYEAASEAEFIEKESYYIETHHTLVPDGYNLTRLTNGTLNPSEETRQKMSRSAQGQQRLRKRHSQYIGVMKSRCGGFMCSVRINRRICGRPFSSEVEAAEAYDKMVLYLYGNKARINFEARRAEWAGSDLKTFYESFIKDRNTSRYLGVGRYRDGVRWRINIHNISKIPIKLSVGLFDSEEEAAVFRDKIVLYFNLGPTVLNFPERREEYLASDLKAFFGAHIATKTSNYEGVSYRPKAKTCPWRAYAYLPNRKQVHLGHYATEEEAHRARVAYLEKRA